jgi:hypothetical protein
MTTPVDDQFPDLDQRGHAAALAVREAVAYSSLTPTDPRLTGRSNRRRSVTFAAVGLAVVAVIGVFVVIRPPDRESQGTAPTPMHFAPSYVPDGLVLFARDGSSSVPDGFPPPGEILVIYERSDGVLVMTVQSDADVPFFPSDGGTETAAPPVHGVEATWTEEPGTPLAYLNWTEGAFRAAIGGQGLTKDELHALAEASTVGDAGVSLATGDLTLRYGPGPIPIFRSTAVAGFSTVTMASADGTTDLGLDEQTLSIVRTVEPPGAEYFIRFFGLGAEPVTLGGHTGFRLVGAEAEGGPHIFVWQEGEATFLATGRMGITEIDRVIASLGPVDDATWQAMLQRTELRGGLAINE